MKKTARLAIESSAFDGRVLLGLDKLGLNPIWQRHEKAGSRAGVWLIGCEPEDDTARHCARCGAAGRIRSSWLRRFAHAPVGQHAVHLMVRVRRYECVPCAPSWTDDLTRVAPEGRRLTEAAVWWAAAEVVLKSKSALAYARDLHCSWGAVNAAVLEKSMDEYLIVWGPWLLGFRATWGLGWLLRFRAGAIAVGGRVWLGSFHHARGVW